MKPPLSPPPRPLLYLFPVPERTVPPTTPGPHLSTLTLHQLRYEELDEGEEQVARAHLEACALCRERLDEQHAFRAAFLRNAPPLRLPDEDDRIDPAAAPAVAGVVDTSPIDLAVPANRPPAASWTRWLAVPVLLAAMAFVAIRLLPATTVEGLDPDPTGVDATDGVEITRLKGAADVQVIVEGQGVLDVGEALRPGDRIQLRIPAGVGSEAWVGDGEDLIGRFDLAPDAPTLSPFALSVDGAGGDEDLVLVIADAPLSRGRATAAMQGDRMDGVTVRRFVLPVDR